MPHSGHEISSLTGPIWFTVQVGPTTPTLCNISPFLSSTRRQPLEEQCLKKLLDQVRDAIRLKHYSHRTERAYVSWIKLHIYFHDVRHASEMGVPEVEAVLAPAASLTAHDAQALHERGPILGGQFVPVALAGVGDKAAHLSVLLGTVGHGARQARRRMSHG